MSIISDVDDFVLRAADFGLDEAERELQHMLREVFDRHCGPERVRAAEPLGFDPELWDRLRDVGLVAMSVPQSRGGDGAGLVELSLAAVEAGRRGAPVPLVETCVAARLLAQIDHPQAKLAVADILSGAVAAVSFGADSDERRLVSAGACARHVVAQHGSQLLLLSADTPPPAAANMACAPMAWWELSGAMVIADAGAAAAAAARCRSELRALTAAALVGLGSSALDDGVRYARDREAFGAAIGSFQAVAHPLVDAAIAVESARRLAAKAAWFGDHEPDQFARAASMAFLHASDAALLATRVAIHTQGGFGFAMESNAQLYYRRAKGWSLAVARPDEELRELADYLYPLNARTDDAEIGR